MPKLPRPGIYAVCEAIDKHHPNNETPAFEPAWSNAKKKGDHQVMLDYLTWERFFKQVQIVGRYGLYGLLNLSRLMAERADWLEKCWGVYTAPDVCQTKGVTKTKAKNGEDRQARWNVKHLCLSYQNGCQSRAVPNMHKIIRVDSSNPKRIMGLVQSIPYRPKNPPNIWLCNPLTQPDKFPILNYVNGRGTFYVNEPGDPDSRRDNIRGMIISTRTGEFWIDMKFVDW
jgi:hypothetical protein